MMKKNLCAGMTAIFLCLAAGVAIAEQTPLPLTDAVQEAPLCLTDDDMDGIAAAGQVTATQAQASALKGHVIAFSITRLVASQVVGVSVASSLAIAVGVHPHTYVSATARNF